MERRGWKSRETLWAAIHELEYYGFIKQTRQGGRHRCSLYAITWWAMNHCQGKLDVRETYSPSNEWQEVMPKFRRKQKKPKNKSRDTIVVQFCPDNRVKGMLKLRSETELFADCPDDRDSLTKVVSR